MARNASSQQPKISPGDQTVSLQASDPAKGNEVEDEQDVFDETDDYNDVEELDVLNLAEDMPIIPGSSWLQRGYYAFNGDTFGAGGSRPESSIYDVTFNNGKIKNGYRVPDYIVNNELGRSCSRTMTISKVSSTGSLDSLSEYGISAGGGYE